MDTKIIQFSAGNGPAECTWVVAQVLKQFLKEIENENYKHQIISKTTGELERTVKSVIIQISGLNVDDYLEKWLGSILWIGSSPYRPNHKRKNWFISCFKIQEKNYCDFDETKIRFQAIRSSGPGGQHANKVSSAVRATHVETGLQVLVSDSRSQHQNKVLATRRLKGKFIEYQQEQLRFDIQTDWEKQANILRGNPVRVFKGNSKSPKLVRENYDRVAQKAKWKKELKNYEY